MKTYENFLTKEYDLTQINDQFLSNLYSDLKDKYLILKRNYNEMKKRNKTLTEQASFFYDPDLDIRNDYISKLENILISNNLMEKSERLIKTEMIRKEKYIAAIQQRDELLSKYNDLKEELNTIIAQRKQNYIDDEVFYHNKKKEA